MTYPRRITVLSQVILVGFGVLFLRLLAVQVSRGEEFRAKAAKRAIETRELETVRGSIVDRNGVVLASSNAITIWHKGCLGCWYRIRSVPASVSSLIHACGTDRLRAN